MSVFEPPLAVLETDVPSVATVDPSFESIKITFTVSRFPDEPISAPTQDTVTVLPLFHTVFVLGCVTETDASAVMVNDGDVLEMVGVSPILAMW